MCGSNFYETDVRTKVRWRFCKNFVAFSEYINITKKLYKQAQSILTAVFSPFTIADKSNECLEYTSNLNLIFFHF